MPKGKFALQKEKEEDLERALRDIYRTAHGRVHYCELSRRLARHPSRRFWVSAEAAYLVIKRMLSGAALDSMRPTKRAMYEELYRRVTKIQREQPDKDLLSVVEEAVEQPAPSFYMTDGTVYVVISRIKRNRRKCRKNTEQ